ncbi:hypothetical protein L6R53_11625 [Myxococcota bacterium]|nr:hypothetical protein [Myxococcota bacterium]
MRRPVTVLGLLTVWLGACGSSEVDPCEEMCAAAADLYGGCLDDWGATWTDAGYADADDFVDGCKTWAWEMRLLEETHAIEGWTDEICVERADLFMEGECSAFTGVDWNAMPWDPSEEDK